MSEDMRWELARLWHQKVDLVREDVLSSVAVYFGTAEMDEFIYIVTELGNAERRLSQLMAKYAGGKGNGLAGKGLAGKG